MEKENMTFFFNNYFKSMMSDNVLVFATSLNQTSEIDPLSGALLPVKGCGAQRPRLVPRAPLRKYNVRRWNQWKLPLDIKQNRYHIALDQLLAAVNANPLPMIFS